MLDAMAINKGIEIFAVTIGGLFICSIIIGVLTGLAIRIAKIIIGQGD